MRGEIMLQACAKDEPITIDMIDSPYANNEELKKQIYNRGIEGRSQAVESQETIHIHRAA
jgi:hypothetical protein